MRKTHRFVLPIVGAASIVGGMGVVASATRGQEPRAVTAPLMFDHNRMLVEAEVQARDGTWRAARLWIDTGNPEFMISETFARALGFDVPSAPAGAATPIGPVSLPSLVVRLKGVPLDFGGVTPTVRPGAQIWATLHADANLPSTVLRRYQVVFDYPARRLELGAAPLTAHRGVPLPARVHPQTGIAQVEVVVGGDRLSFALDIGASYSFVSGTLLATLAGRHKDWPRANGAFGCANIWGLWPQEERWPVLRVPEIRVGDTRIAGVGVVGLPNLFGNDVDLGTWYSQKTAAPVVGFLGPNAFKGFRLEIDYAHETIYLERRAPDEVHDMDLVGLTLQPAGDRWRVLGAAVGGIEPGDVLLQVDNLPASGATMGTVVDALRGAPGDVRVLIVERQGKRLRVEARVRRFM